MSKAGGLVLIVGGLTVAAYVMAPDDDASGSEAARQAEFAKSARVEQRPGQDIAVPMPQPAPVIRTILSFRSGFMECQGGLAPHAGCSSPPGFEGRSEMSPSGSRLATESVSAGAIGLRNIASLWQTSTALAC